MRFHRVRLTDYRGIHHCEFEPRETGVTVLEGDNEVGKSSIAEALWLVFEQHDDSSSQLVKSLQPVGRDTGTEVEVEVSTGPYRFRYYKRFNKQHRTELTILAPSPETLTGREAHNRAKAMLEETIDVALWKALRSQQGNEGSLEPPPAGEHRSLAGAFGEREMAVLKAAEAEYLRYYTRSGRERTGQDGVNLPALRDAEAAAAAEVNRVSARIEELEGKAIRAAELERFLAETATALAAATKLQGDLSDRMRARQEAGDTVHRLRAELKAKDAEALRLTAEAERRTRALESIAPRRAGLEEEQQQAAVEMARLETLTQALTGASLAADEAASAVATAQKVAATVDDLVNLSARQLQVDQMAERLARLRTLEPEMAELETWLAECRVDRQVLGGLERMSREYGDLVAKKRAETAYVEISAPIDTEIMLDGKPVSMVAGQARGGHVRGETTMTFPGGITVRVRAGDLAQKLEEQERAALDRLNGALAQARVATVEEAHAVSNERSAREERLKQFTAQRQADLRDLGSPDELAAKLDRERAAISGILRDAGLAEAPTVEAAKAHREQAQAALVEREAALAAANRAREAVRTEFEDANRAAGVTAARIDSRRDELERAERELAEARATYPDEALTRAVTAATEAKESAEAALRRAEAEFAGLEDVEQPLREATIELNRLKAEEASASREHAGAEAVLEAAGAEGLHGRLIAARQNLDVATEERAAATRRAAGAKLLYETLQRTHDEARERYAQPLQQRIEELGRRVYGSSFAVDLSDDLQVVKRSLNGVKLDLPQVSIGGREQLAVLTRLAFAGIASHDGGVPLVLDDILGWADPRRMAAIGPVLAEAAGTSQVLLFTCSPERFASVSPARVIRLPGGQCSERMTPAVPGESEPAPPKPRPQPAGGARPSAPQGAFDLFATRSE